MKKLAKITDGLIGQKMFHLLGQAQKMEREGKKIIHFEIGDPNFNSPIRAIEEAKRALDNNLTHYTNSMGILEFREMIANYTEINLGFKPLVSQILVCPANAIIDFVARCVVNPGEEIIYPDPGFPTYFSVINYNGMIPVGVELKEKNGFRMSPDDIRSKITDKTRLIIINTPQNPTGAVMTEEETLEVARIAGQHDIYILSDEVYAKITYDKKHYSPAVVDQCKERTICLSSLSKIYSMAGWRLGYAIGPEKLIEKMGLLLQTILSCLPAFTQHGGMAAISGEQSFVLDRNDMLRKRRDILIKGLNSLPGISCVIPDGAFYVLPNISGTGMNGDQFCERILEEAGVCICPGSCFGKFGEKYVRLCYASTEETMIEEALRKMQEVLR